MPEYGGKYCSFTPGHPNFVDEAEYQALVDAHIAFKDMSADSYLLSAGIAQHWPHGRGVYVSEDKGFIIWVGEEDHLRIMCMEKGTVLNKVFDRLKAALDVVNGIEGLEFATSAVYGVVTSCPTNLGTGMRASLHIALPNLTSDGTDAKAKAIAKPLGLSVRGLGGEHTPIGADGTVDISPSARFCITEAEIITALYKGTESLNAAENFPAHVAKLSVENPDNICLQVFDPEYYASLSDEDKAGLRLCMNSGVENVDSGMGCYACQPSDYDRFKPFFSKALAKYHKVAEDAKHVNDWSLEGVEGLPEGGVLDIAALGLPELSMRVRVGRNLKEFPLPGAMTQEDRCNMENFDAGRRSRSYLPCRSTVASTAPSRRATRTLSTRPSTRHSWTHTLRSRTCRWTVPAVCWDRVSTGRTVAAVTFQRTRASSSGWARRTTCASCAWRRAPS